MMRLTDLDKCSSHDLFELGKITDCIKEAMSIAEYIRHNSAFLLTETITKQDMSPVTVADYCCQIIINACLSSLQQFETVCVISEESSSVLKANKEVSELCCKIINEVAKKDLSVEQIFALLDYGKSCKTSNSFWVIDPVDGTKGFLRGGHYAICLAYVENDVPIFGILGCPTIHKGTILYAMKGKGAYQMNIQTLEVTKLSCGKIQKSLSECIFASSFEKSHSNSEFLHSLMHQVNCSTEMLPVDSQVKYAFVANGTADIYIRYPSKSRKEKIWDHAAGSLIVRESGGKVTDLSGKELKFITDELNIDRLILCCSNANIHSQIISVLQEKINSMSGQSNS